MSLRPTRDEALRRRIGLRLRNARKRMGITAEEAASKLDVSRPYVTMIELGGDGPSIELLVKMVQLYSISADFALCLID